MKGLLCFFTFVLHEILVTLIIKHTQLIILPLIALCEIAQQNPRKKQQLEYSRSYS